MFKNVVSIVLMFDRSGKNFKVERLELESGSLINLAENLARFEVRLNSY